MLALTIGFALCALTCGSKNTSGSNQLIAQVCPDSPMRVTTTQAMTPMEFCMVFMEICVGADMPPGGYLTEAECEAGYTALMFDSTRECRSYHLCNASTYDPTNALMHCGHAVGIALCGDVGP